MVRELDLILVLKICSVVVVHLIFVMALAVGHGDINITRDAKFR